jgi:hypothetical protein
MGKFFGSEFEIGKCSWASWQVFMSVMAKSSFEKKFLITPSRSKVVYRIGAWALLGSLGGPTDTPSSISRDHNLCNSFPPKSPNMFAWKHQISKLVFQPFWNSCCPVFGTARVPLRDCKRVTAV